MARSSGKTTKKHVEAPVNGYEKQRLERIQANNKIFENLGIKRIVASMTSPLDSTKENKGLIRSKSKATLHRDSDYTPEDDPLDDDNDDEDNAAHKKRKVQFIFFNKKWHVTSKECMKKGTKRIFIPPKSIYNLLKHNNRQGNEYKDGNMHLTTAIKVLQQAIHSQQKKDGQEKMVSDECNEDRNSQGNMVNNGKDMLLEKEEEPNITGKRKLKKSYKTKTPRGPTRNLQMAKMRPGEKIKVDFDVSGQPIGANRAKLSSYCGCLVIDPLNALLHGVEEFSQVPDQNNEKMWKLVLDKFDIGLGDDQEEEKREKRRRERRKYIMTSLNKKYRNYRVRLKSEYYDVEENDEDRLKEENRSPCVDKKYWEWLVEYFGSVKFQKKSVRNIKNRSYLDAGHTAATKSFAQKAQDKFERDKVMPGLLDLYEETHTRGDKKPVTQTAQETMNEIKQLLEQRKTGETKMTDKEIYAKVKPKRKISDRDRGKGISPSVTSLFGSFSEGEKLRKEAEAAKNKANEAKKEAIEANEKNKTLSNRLKGLGKESRAMNVPWKASWLWLDTSCLI